MDFANESKKLWQLLNQVICKTKNRGSIVPYITIDGLKMYNPSKMANAFGKFYLNLGKDLASETKPGSQSIHHYLGKIPRNVHSLLMRLTNEKEIKKIIEQLFKSISYPPA